MGIFVKLFFKYFLPIFVTLYSIWHVLRPDWMIHLAVVGLLSVIGWTCAYCLFDKINDNIISDRKRCVLITGCDTGFGNRLARRLDTFGLHVFAGVYSIDSKEAKQLQEECSPRLRVVQMDITKADQVAAVVEQIRESQLPLWALVNNAGIMIEAPFDWGEDIEILQKTFDVNVFGAFRVTKACVNLLRKSQGRIVNVASLAGRITPPTISTYCMSKHAVRSFSDAIRRELCRHNIDVVTIEPTFYRTNIIDFEAVERMQRTYFERTDLETKSHYSEANFNKSKTVHKVVNLLARTNTEEVVDTLFTAVTRSVVKPFYRCCGYHDIVVWIMGILPETILDFFIGLVRMY